MINNQLSIIHRKGVALLVVLFVVMVITITALGFLSKSDVELACGQNMKLRVEMDSTAESGLAHARGLIISPQDVGSEYWSGDAAQQTAGGDDYYDLDIVRDDSDPTDRCNYIIDCNSYRLSGGEKIGRSNIRAQLRLDPCIAYWARAGTTIWQRVTINGDMYCAGNLANSGSIGGDVFAVGTVSGGGIEGRLNQWVAEAPVDWPGIQAGDFGSTYYIGPGAYAPVIVGSYVHPSGSFSPSGSNPGGVRYHNGDAELPGNVTINGLLAVAGDLTIRGSNTITAVKNFGALLVAGDVTIEAGGKLEITGLMVVEGRVRVSSNDGDLDIVGGLFTRDGLVETVTDSSGNGNTGMLCNGPLWQFGEKLGDSLKFDGANDYVEVDNESNFDVITDQLTVSAWIKVNAFTRDFQAIVTKGDNAWRIQRWSNTNCIEFACTGLAHNSYGHVIGNIAVDDEQWHHVAGVYDGTKIYLYIDGNTDVSAATSGWINTNNYSVMIGGNAERPERCWNGMIDDVRVYRRGLSAEEVNIIKAGGTVPDPNNLIVGHWELDDEGGCDVDITAAPCKSAIMIWSSGGVADKWGQVGGAFFRSIRRRQ